MKNTTTPNLKEDTIAEDVISLKTKYAQLLQNNNELSHDLDALGSRYSITYDSFIRDGETVTCGGFIGKLYKDTDVACPLEEEGGRNDDFIRFITFETNNHLAEYHDFITNEEVIEFAKAEGWHVFNLYMSQHSGVVYEVDIDGDRRADDKSHAGFIIVSHTTSKADYYALELCEVINNYCAGESYCFETFTPNLERMEVEHGFSGHYHALECLKQTLYAYTVGKLLNEKMRKKASRPLIETNPYLKDPEQRNRLITRSVLTSSAVEGIYTTTVTDGRSDKEVVDQCYEWATNIVAKTIFPGFTGLCFEDVYHIAADFADWDSRDSTCLSFDPSRFAKQLKTDQRFVDLVYEWDCEQ